ncbi:unnamed protein product, partial [Pleuronectes platessa]
STDYGSTYERMNDKVGSKIVLSYLYVCPTNKRKIMVLTDPEFESSVLISSDEGASYQKYRLTFYVLSLLFHPTEEDWALAYSHDQKTARRTVKTKTVAKFNESRPLHEGRIYIKQRGRKFMKAEATETWIWQLHINEAAGVSACSDHGYYEDVTNDTLICVIIGTIGLGIITTCARVLFAHRNHLPGAVEANTQQQMFFI